MESEPTTEHPEFEEKSNNFNKVTPLSKYLAMALFIIMPFVGGWIGYTYSPVKVVETERVIVKEVEKTVAVESEQGNNTDSYQYIKKADEKDGWITYQNPEHGFEISYPEEMSLQLGGDASQIATLFTSGGPGVDGIGNAKFYVSEAKEATFDEFVENTKNGYLDEDSLDIKEVVYAEYESMGGFKYTFQKEVVGGYEVLFHKRNFYSMIGQVNTMSVWLGDGKVLDVYLETDADMSEVYGTLMKL